MILLGEKKRGEVHPGHDYWKEWERGRQIVKDLQQYIWDERPDERVEYTDWLNDDPVGCGEWFLEQAEIERQKELQAREGDPQTHTEE